MKKIVNNLKEEEFFLREVNEDEMEQIENGGMCFFWTRCVRFSQYPGLQCPFKQCKRYVC